MIFNEHRKITKMKENFKSDKTKMSLESESSSDGVRRREGSNLYLSV